MEDTPSAIPSWPSAGAAAQQTDDNTGSALHDRAPPQDADWAQQVLLDADLLMRIFQHCSLLDARVVQRVCKTWAAVAQTRLAFIQLQHTHCSVSPRGCCDGRDIRRISKSWSWLPPRGLQRIQHLPHLRELVLPGVGLTCTGATDLAAKLPALTALRTMRLNANCIREAGAVALGRPLSMLRALEELDLGWNQLGDAGVAAIAPALQSLLRISCLDLTGNGFGDEGAVCLASGWGAMQAAQEAAGAAARPEELGLAHNTIEESGWRALLRLPVPRVKRVLRVDAQMVECAEAACLAGLGTGVTLDASNPKDAWCSVQRLCGTSGLLINACGRPLRCFRQVTRFEWSPTSALLVSRTPQVARFLPALVNLIQVRFQAPGEHSHAALFRTLGPHLPALPHLSTLVAANVKLLAAGCRCVAWVLPQLPHLRMLNLANNAVGDRGLALLLPALRGLHDLVLLNLGDNGVTDAGVVSLVRDGLAVEGSLPQLKHLLLVSNLITAQGVPVLARWAGGSKVERVMLWGNCVAEEEQGWFADVQQLDFRQIV